MRRRREHKYIAPKPTLVLLLAYAAITIAAKDLKTGKNTYKATVDVT